MADNSPAKRACDQCHSLKEKCRRPDINSACERCSRLQLTCVTRRQAIKTGRKPRSLQKLSYTLPSSTYLCLKTRNGYISSPREILSLPSPYDGGLATNSALFPTLDEWERHFLTLMKDTLSPSPLDKFLVGSSFHESHHVAFIRSFIGPSRALKHATVACAAVLLGEGNDEYAKASAEIGHKRAALAVSSLRSFKILNEQDLATALFLGVAMVTFAMHVADGQPLLISHHTLNLVRPQIQNVYAMESTIVDYWMCLVSTELFDCLLRSEIPSIRIDPSRRHRVVDRYLGVSSSIFTHFYDICSAAQSLKQASIATVVKIASHLDTIRTAVDQWQPSPPLGFLDQYTQTEVVSMLSQAKIFRLAALLIIHRLRYPFGEQDREASVLSWAIISEFDTALQFTRRSVPCTMLAYLAACFEIMDPHAQNIALEKSQDIITFSKVSRLKFQTTLKSVWAIRDSRRHFHWFEISQYVSLGTACK